MDTVTGEMDRKAVKPQQSIPEVRFSGVRVCGTMHETHYKVIYEA